MSKTRSLSWRVVVQLVSGLIGIQCVCSSCPLHLRSVDALQIHINTAEYKADIVNPYYYYWPSYPTVYSLQINYYIGIKSSQNSPVQIMGKMLYNGPNKWPKLCTWLVHYYIIYNQDSGVLRLSAYQIESFTSVGITISVMASVLLS